LGNELNLGIGISFDSATLNELNSLLSFIKKLQKQMDSLGDPLTKAKKATTDLNKEFENLNLKSKQISKTVENVGKSITNSYDTGRGKIAQVTKDMEGQVSKIKLIDNGFRSIGESIVRNIGKFTEWTLAAGAIFTVVNGIKKAFQTISQTEVSGIKVQRVLPTGANMGVINEGANTIAQRYGETLTDTMTAMEGWSRKFKDVNDVVKMTGASLRLITTTDINLENSFADLSAIMTQFGHNTSFARHEVDSLNEMSNNLRTTSQDVAAGLAKVGSAARIMGIDFDRATALVAVGVEVTAASGEEVGTTLNRMLSRFHAEGAIEQLKKVGIDAFQPVQKSLDELGLHWNQYSKLEQEAIARSLGGIVQWQKTASILSNYNRVIEATLLSYNSFGSTQREIDLDLSSFQKKTEQLNSSLQVLSVSMGNGVLPVFKNFVDGLRVLITLGDGIIPKLALIAGATWGVIAAFQAWQKANFVLSTTGIIGLIAGGFTLASILIGWAASVNKVAEATNRLSQSEQSLSYIKERGNQINYLAEIHEKLYEKLQRLKKGTEDYNETLNLYKRVQSQINDLGREFGVVKDKNLTKYEGEKKQIDLLIDKIAELDKKRQQAYENEIKRQIANTKPQVDQWQKLMDLKTQYYDARSKVRQIDWNPNNLAGSPADVKQVKDLRLQMQQWIMNLPSSMMNEFQKTMAIGQINSDTTKFLKQQEQAFNQSNLSLLDLQKKQLEMGLVKGVSPSGDPGDETNKNTVAYIMEEYAKKQEVINTLASKNIVGYYALNEEIQLLSGTMSQLRGASDFLEKGLGQYDKFSKDLIDKNLQYDKQQTLPMTHQRAMDQYYGSLKSPTDEELQASDKKWKKYFTDLSELNEYMNKLSLEGSIKFAENQAKIEEQALKEIANWENRNKSSLELLIQQAEFYGLSEDIINKLKKIDESPIFGGVFISSIKSAANALNELGNGARFFGTALNIAADAFDVDTGKFDFKADLVNIITELINETIAVFAETKKDIEQYGGRMADFGKFTNTSASSFGQEISNFKNYDANYERYMELMVALTSLDSNNFFGQNDAKIEKVQKQLDELSGRLTNVLGQLTEALGVSVQNIADSLSGAFQADTYMGFLTNWNQSLYEMTRSALIKGFLASETVQPLMKGLSETIALSTYDGIITSQELLNIRTASNSLQPLMQNLYGALGMLDTGMINNGGNGGSQGGQQTYQSGSLVPVTNNIYVTIEAGIFWGDPEQARSAAIEIGNLYAEEMGRA
jgi:TP901 family phage tail tape measure protein